MDTDLSVRICHDGVRILDMVVIFVLLRPGEPNAGPEAHKGNEQDELEHSSSINGRLLWLSSKFGVSIASPVAAAQA